MALRVYNTLTRRKEDFATIEPGRVRMYVCGVTVYGPAHIGHGFMVLSFDIIRRYLTWLGYEVQHAQNFTDVDDKIINRAAELGVEPTALANGYVEEWQRDIADLGVLAPTIAPRATLEIDGMLMMIAGLIERGIAYEAGGDVYFRVRRFEEYGKLSGRNLDDLLSGARVEVGEQKEDPLDFALWKAAKPGEIAWESPWGPGRPGWHIECSVMASHHLGDQIDIHGGGTDLIFPHHENEIAQSEAFTDKDPFARYWLHNEMLQLGGNKMSKSLGNLITLRELLDRDPDNGQVFRFMALTGHYRTPLTWTQESFDGARRGLERLRSGLRGYDPAASVVGDGGALAGAMATAEAGFRAGMDDDFNTTVAVAALFELARAINRARDEGAPAADIAAGQAKLAELVGVLGLTIASEELDLIELLPSLQALNSEVHPNLQKLGGEPLQALIAGNLHQLGWNTSEDARQAIDTFLHVRVELRKAKQFALSDRIRDRLKELGVEVEDSPQGSTWRMRRATA